MALQVQQFKAKRFNSAGHEPRISRRGSGNIGIVKAMNRIIDRTTEPVVIDNIKAMIVAIKLAM